MEGFLGEPTPSRQAESAPLSKAKLRKGKKRTNLTALANNIGVSRQTIHSWKVAGAPVDEGEDAVTAWALARNKNGHDSDAMAKAKLEIATQRARQLKRENDKADDMLADRGEVRTCVTRAMGLLFGTLDQLSDTLPSIMHGMDANQIKATLAKAIEELKDQLKARFEAWE